jgi:hypothetical protein
MMMETVCRQQLGDFGSKPQYIDKADPAPLSKSRTSKMTEHLVEIPDIEKVV